MSLDYETLRLLWWALLVLGMIGFALAEGLLVGVTLLLKLSAKTDTDRQTVLNGITPAAMGLQAWLIAITALLFAAWPIVYTVAFSSFQAVLILMLVAWLGRLPGLYFRNASENADWRQNWDKALSYGGLLIAALLGIICGNLLKGVPFHLDSDMRIFFLGDFWGLLNPFALLLAAVSVTLFALYGAAFLQLKNSGDIYIASRSLMFKAGLAFLVLFALAGLWVTRLEGYHITSEFFPNGDANPLNKFVKRNDGLWLDNYEHQPSLWVIPALVFISAGVSLYLTKLHRSYFAFLATSITVVFSVLTVAISMFPFLLPSNRSLNSSLTIWDASASFNSLTMLLWPVIIALPLLAVLSRWSFWIERK